mmetsp:Transcript_38897/g.34570  ORF Transcript_38897/g.34570 Transcript_38897/m.34570 type:complete len:216 (-) Transcript_38897:2153-2800(-)
MVLHKSLEVFLFSLLLIQELDRRSLLINQQIIVEFSLQKLTILINNNTNDLISIIRNQRHDLNVIDNIVTRLLSIGGSAQHFLELSSTVRNDLLFSVFSNILSHVSLEIGIQELGEQSADNFSSNSIALLGGLVFGFDVSRVEVSEVVVNFIVVDVVILPSEVEFNGDLLLFLTQEGSEPNIIIKLVEGSLVDSFNAVVDVVNINLFFAFCGWLS